MKTLYTGHVTISKQYVYSFIYAATLMEAEEYLTTLLNRYVREQFVVPSTISYIPVKVVSRPNGWTPPDGYYLPPTSKQYALKYSDQRQTAMVVPDSNVLDLPIHLSIDSGAGFVDNNLPLVSN